jgi:uncharacterized membrane protein
MTFCVASVTAARPGKFAMHLQIIQNAFVIARVIGRQIIAHDW